MPNRIPHLLLDRCLWLLVLAVLVASGILAHSTDDAHWVNRGGALIAALAAGSVLLQIAVEIGLEHTRHEIEARRNATALPLEPSSPIDRLAKRLQAGDSIRQVKRLERQRLHIALRVVACAMLGELLHGFGDLAACHLFMLCAGHG